MSSCNFLDSAISQDLKRLNIQIVCNRFQPEFAGINMIHMPHVDQYISDSNKIWSILDSVYGFLRLIAQRFLDSSNGQLNWCAQETILLFKVFFEQNQRFCLKKIGFCMGFLPLESSNNDLQWFLDPIWGDFLKLTLFSKDQHIKVMSCFSFYPFSVLVWVSFSLVFSSFFDPPWSPFPYSSSLSFC